MPHRADLVTESTKVEVRDLTQTTYSNQRGHVRETRFGLQITSGPNHQFAGPVTDVRVQGGPVVRGPRRRARPLPGHRRGPQGDRPARNQPMALYRVERTLMVRGAGEPRSAARPVRVVSLDWMSTQDARRLAGWDSRTPGRTGPNPDVEPRCRGTSRRRTRSISEARSARRASGPRTRPGTCPGPPAPGPLRHRPADGAGAERHPEAPATPCRRSRTRSWTPCTPPTLRCSSRPRCGTTRGWRGSGTATSGCGRRGSTNGR